MQTYHNQCVFMFFNVILLLFVNRWKEFVECLSREIGYFNICIGLKFARRIGSVGCIGSTCQDSYQILFWIDLTFPNSYFEASTFLEIPLVAPPRRRQILRNPVGLLYSN